MSFLGSRAGIEPERHSVPARMSKTKAILVALIVWSSTAAAQEVTLHRTGRGPAPAMDGSVEGTLEQLCARFAKAPAEMRGGTITCRRVDTSAGLVAIDAGHLDGTDLYLADALPGARLRLVAKLASVLSGPTEGSDARIARVLRPPAWTAHDLVLVEYETSYVNWENTEVVGWSRRSATVCRLGAPTRCTGELPLAWDGFHGRNEDGGFAAVEGYQVVARVRASATIVARPDGTLRHRLVRGTWRQLFGSDWGFSVPSAYVEGTIRIDHAPLVMLAATPSDR